VSVVSNIKSPSGETWTLDLGEGQHTLLVGSNTSHKSSVLNAIELATSGCADDVAGRSAVRDPALLLTLAPADKLSAEVVWDDGSASTFSIERKGKTIKKPVHTTGEEVVLPLREVREALSGGLDKARQVFLGWAADDVTPEDVLAHLPTPLHAKYTDITEKMRKPRVVDTLLAVTDYAGKRQRNAAKEAKGAQSVIEAIGGQLPSRPSDAEMSGCREALEAAEEAYDLALRCRQSTKPTIDVDATTQQLTKAWQAKNAWEAEREVARTAVAAAEDGYSSHAYAVLAYATSNNLSQCPACSSSVKLAHLQACQDHYGARYQASSDADDRYLDTITSLSGWEDEVSRLQTLLDEAAPEPHIVLVPAVSEEDARNQVHAARQTLVDLERAVSRWGDMSAARDTAAAMEKDAADYKWLASACTKAIGALLASQAASFSAKVQKYLPKAWIFGVELEDEGRKVFRMGLKRGNKLHCALSGAEWATVTTAVAMAIVGDQTSLLIPEDRAWDSKTLKSVMQAFSAFPGQVVLASTERPSGRLPKGWDMINMDDWLKQQAVAEEPEEEAKVEAPKVSNGKGVSKSSHRILKGMGFAPKLIKVMLADTAAELIRLGVVAKQVRINNDGSWSYRSDSSHMPS
jgi:hypothetical protein